MVYRIFLLILLYITYTPSLVTGTDLPTKNNVEKTTSSTITPSISGKNEKLTNAFTQKELSPYKYYPVIPEFWNEVQLKIKLNKYSDIFDLAKEQISSYGEDSPEGYEALASQAMSLRLLGYNVAAFYHFMEIAQKQIGTNVGTFALYHLSEIALSEEYNQKDLMTFMDGIELTGLHYQIQDFVSYHKSKVLLKYGHINWAKKHLKIMTKNSPWDLVRQYWSTIALVARNKGAKAFQKLTVLLEQENLPPKFKSRANLQLARLHFEAGRFKEAWVHYSKVKNQSLREKGRVLQEKAWTLFYLKDYDKSLGLLQSLKTPYFQKSLNPEMFILEMLIFNELCHYPAVYNVGKIFRKFFSKSLIRIRKRWSLERDPMLFSMAAMDLEIQPSANLIAKIREELTTFNKFKGFAFYTPLKRSLKKKDLELQVRIAGKIETKVRNAATELIDSYEQIQFLEHVSSIAATKVVLQQEGSDFKSKPIENYRFNKIYWPIPENPWGEHWFDELENYQMKISSLCQEENDEKQIKLEENFE